MYCDWLQDVTCNQAMMPWFRETPFELPTDGGSP